ncbi:hypothetical protein J15TS10_25390 [Paenibacillus woosongensis]|uniref:Uncharacterized protein n=1 Tax=Paenibacillus woosongensis TaxID=307580 RepID=A0ABQ4MRV1_9BACL|nr:hypothetical protein J15TS10_25390 [Paenibacillus woosongensis]
MPLGLPIPELKAVPEPDTKFPEAAPEAAEGLAVVEVDLPAGFFFFAYIARNMSGTTRSRSIALAAHFSAPVKKEWLVFIKMVFHGKPVRISTHMLNAAHNKVNKMVIAYFFTNIGIHPFGQNYSLIM